MGLLQSKHFRRKLGKWVIMYVVCMMFFTTVITYSKYVSKLLGGDDTARVSKFDVKLIYCSSENSCDNKELITKYRPSQEMIYYFASDSRDLETSADIYYTIKTDRHFKIKEIYKDGNKVTNDSIVSTSNDNKTISIKDTVEAGNGTLSKYKVVVVYDTSVIDYNTKGEIVNGIVNNDDGSVKYIFTENMKYNAINIGYSAVQKR